MTSDERIARAQRWRAFFEEPGGMAEMLKAMRATHLEALSLVDPWDTDRLKKIGLSMAMVQQLEQTIRSIMADGTIAIHAAEHAERIQALPDRKKRWI